ncbi:MAG TPA: ABC transporter permease [Solirubrobacteraceae bacterium]|jgi:ribose transport system permease protein
MSLTEQSPVIADLGDPAPSGRARERLGRFVPYAARYGLIAFLLLLIAVFSILQPQIFFTFRMAKTILVQQTVIMLLSLSVLPIVVVGEFDLSIGNVLGFAAVLIAALGEKSLGGWPTLLLTVLACAAIGGINGFLVSVLKVPSMIATLGVGLAVGGLTVGVSGGETLVSGIPNLIPDMSSTIVLGVSLAVWIVFALCLVTYAVFEHTPTGRRLYAVGGSQVVARLAGIRVTRLKFLAFTAGAALVAVAGALNLGQAGGASPSFGPSLLLPAYAAVFLGSTTIRPGFFNVWGTVVATLVLAVGFTGLTLEGVPYWVEPVFDGVALIIGVLLSRGEVTRAGR